MKGSFARACAAGLSCVTALTLGACGSSGGTGQDPGSGVASISASPEVVALLPVNIAKSKTLVVGVLSGGSSSFDTMSGTSIVGFDPDLIKAIGAVLGVRVEIKPAAFDSMVAGVAAGRYDVTIGEMGDTKAREASVSFVDYLDIGVSVVVKHGNPAHIKGANDLCGRTVALTTGGYPQSTLVPKLSAACTEAGKPVLRVLSFGQPNAAVLAVHSGRADCIYGDSAVAAHLLKTTTNEFEQAGPSQTLTPAGIAFAKTNTQLGRAVAAALQALMTSGEYATIAKRWGMTDAMLTAPSINKALI